LLEQRPWEWNSNIFFNPQEAIASTVFGWKRHRSCYQDAVAAPKCS
jgi:hypothetical protein